MVDLLFLSCFLSNDVSSLPNSLFPGFHFNSIPKPASLSQAPMHSTVPSFMPFCPSGPPLLGCCETPVVSLAEAQQELQMLQKQLGESEHCCCLGVLLSGRPLAVALHGFGLMVVKGKARVTGGRCRQSSLASCLKCIFSCLWGVHISYGRYSETRHSQTANRVSPTLYVSIHPWQTGKYLSVGGIKKLCFALVGGHS